MPLASGLLSGKITRDSKFAKDDHRNFNRHGEAFDRGETFSGVDFETGLHAVEELKPFVPEGATLAQLALRWILEFPAVTCAIPGAKRPAQVAENIAASDLPPLSAGGDEKNRRALRRADQAAGASLLVKLNLTFRIKKLKLPYLCRRKWIPNEWEIETWFCRHNLLGGFFSSCPGCTSFSAH